MFKRKIGVGTSIFGFVRRDLRTSHLVAASREVNVRKAAELRVKGNGARFSCMEIAMPSNSNCNTVEDIVSEIQTHNQCKSVKYGIAIFHSGANKGDNIMGDDDIVIPVTDGKVQIHLSTALPRDKSDGATADDSVSRRNKRVYLCSFNARARARVGDYSGLSNQTDHKHFSRFTAECSSEDEDEDEDEDEEDEVEEGGDGKCNCTLSASTASAGDSRRLKPSRAGGPSSTSQRVVDSGREAALNTQLAALHIDYTELLPPDGKYVGTAPSRIYRSFVFPRLYRQQVAPHTEFPKAVALVAAQIDVSLRQVRADHAVYLRNVDRMGALRRPQRAVELRAQAKGANEEAMLTSVSTQQTASVSAAGSAAAQHPIVLVLDSIRSAFNVGSLFRTSDTAGVAEVITTGITCKPPHPKLLKTAMQSIDHVRHRHFEDIVSCVKALKGEGYQIVVMETTAKSQHYMQVEYPAKTALICGNEITGVDVRAIELADLMVEIPTYGVKNSLNVAAAVPVVLFAIVQQIRDKMAR